MDIRITLPEYGKENKSIKDLAVSILIYKHPLTLKELYQEIKKQYRHEGSYQAVHKAVKELVRDNVLTKSRNNIEINGQWISLLAKFHEILRENYPHDALESGAILTKEKITESIEELIEKRAEEEEGSSEEAHSGDDDDDNDDEDDDDTEEEKLLGQDAPKISDEEIEAKQDDVMPQQDMQQEAQQEIRKD
jgi:phosphopantothenoylcysteine synthetase/decarboxylase